MKKLITIIIITFISLNGISQEKEQDELLHQKDSALPLIIHSPIKNSEELNLSNRQKNHLKKQQKSINAKRISIVKNAALTKNQKKDKLNQLKIEEHKKLQSILTPDQKEKMKQKENKPRRGVTNMPNERTVR